MIERITEAEDFIERKRKEGKVTVLDSPENVKITFKLNENLEKFRREYQEKERQSNIDALNIIVK
ncbi:hypothetical protein LJC73_01535 [Bacteroidales bacterium OttesenSCG-928-L14]|nr:hypothetical protein [Bacteroidales bacterium OttesenSCG-928-L14]